MSIETIDKVHIYTIVHKEIEQYKDIPSIENIYETNVLNTIPSRSVQQGFFWKNSLKVQQDKPTIQKEKNNIATTTAITTTIANKDNSVIDIDTNTKNYTNNSIIDINNSVVDNREEIYTNNAVNNREEIYTNNAVDNIEEINTNNTVDIDITEKRKKEIYTKIKKQYKASFFGIPQQLLTMVLHHIKSCREQLYTFVFNSQIVQSQITWLLSTCVQWYIGIDFYKYAQYNQLRKNITMQLLISLSTSLSYQTAFILTLCQQITPHENIWHECSDNKTEQCKGPLWVYIHANTSHFYETGSTLQLVSVLGKVQEDLTREFTYKYIKRLTNRNNTTTLVGIYKINKKLTTESSYVQDIIISNKILIKDLKKYDIVSIKRGEMIPVDGIIQSCLENTYVNESAVTGESKPVLKKKNDKVIGTTYCEEGGMLIQIEYTEKDSMIYKIIDLVEKNQKYRTNLSSILDTITSYYLPIIQLISLLTLLIWTTIITSTSWIKEKKDGIMNEHPFQLALTFSLSVLVVSCPCAFGQVVPTVMMSGVGIGAKYGILMKGNTVQERINHIDHIVFDKTGTLTMGKPTVRQMFTQYNDICIQNNILNISPSSSYNTIEKIIAFSAGSAEKYSDHIIGKCIVEWAESIQGQNNNDVLLKKIDQGNIKSISYYMYDKFEKCSSNFNSKNDNATSAATNNTVSSISQATPSDVEIITGKGIKCIINNKKICIGSQSFLKDNNIYNIDNNSIIYKTYNIVLNNYKQCTPVQLAIDGWCICILNIYDPQRPGAKEQIHIQKKKNINIWLCSGDISPIANYTAKQLNIPEDNVISNALPKDKYELISKLQDNNKIVMMAGHGINDSLALQKSNLAVSFYNSIDQSKIADIILMDTNIQNIYTAIDLAKTMHRRILYNLFWAFIYNLFSIPIAAGILYIPFSICLQPSVSGIMMAMSSIAILLSSLQLHLYKPPYLDIDYTSIYDAESPRKIFDNYQNINFNETLIDDTTTKDSISYIDAHDANNEYDAIDKQNPQFSTN